MVSVIVPVHNQREYVGQVVECLAGQSHPHIEAIYVDDGSTDGSGELLEELVGAGGKVIHQPNRGLSSARNTGLGQASGELVQFLDADDLISEEKLAQDTAYLADHPEVDLVTCAASYFRESLGRQRGAEGVRPFGDMLVALLGGNRLAAHGPLVRRAALSRVGLFNVNLPSCEDWDYWLRFAAAGLRAEFVPGVRAFTRLHGERMSGDGDRMLSGARAVLSRARGIEEARQSDPAFAFALAASHTTWCLKARAAGGEEPAEEFRRPIAGWLSRLPEGFVHEEFTAGEHLLLWTRVLLAFGEEAETFERARREWHGAADRIGRVPEAAGIRALLAAQQSLESSVVKDRLDDAIGRAEALAVKLHRVMGRPAVCEGPGRHVEEVLGQMRERGHQRILIYGGGEHTRWLLTEFDLGGFEIAGIMDDEARLWGSSMLGIEVSAPRWAAEAQFDAVLISSDRYEARLAERARRIFPEGQVYRMYQGPSIGSAVAAK